MQYKKYQHVERLGVYEVEGLLDGKVYAQPKLDGTNSSVYLNDLGELSFGGRKRELTLHNDNREFAHTMMEHKDLFMSILTKHKDWTIFGEWLVQHVVKYESEAYYHFYVFDVYDNTKQKYLPYEEYIDEIKQAKLHYVPVVKILDHPDFETITKIAPELTKYNTFEGNVGEGIVLKRYDFVNKLGDTVWGKYVLSDFKKNHRRKTSLVKHANTEAEDVYRAHAEQFITKAFVEKEYAKFIENHNGIFRSKYIGELLNTLWYEFMNEDFYHYLQTFKVLPTVNFKLLQIVVNNLIKENLPLIFGK